MEPPDGPDEVGFFSGTYQHGLDPKGRLVLPADFRRQFGSRAIVTPRSGYLGCYTPAGFEHFIASISEGTPGPSATVAMRERIAEVSPGVALDPQGRMVLPAALRNHYSIGDTARVVGRFDHVGIFADVEEDFSAVIDFIADLGNTPAQ